jgi:hypothetical protein
MNQPHYPLLVNGDVLRAQYRDGADFSLSVTLKPSKDRHYAMTDTIRRLAASKLQRWGVKAFAV